MDAKIKLRDDVILDMGRFLKSEELNILEDVLIKHLQAYDISMPETLPATTTDINEYYIGLYTQLKSQKIAQSTIKAYLYSVRKLLSVVDKPLNQITAMDIEYYLYSIRKNNNERSLDNQRRNLASFFNFLKKKKIINDNPCDEVEPYKAPDLPVEYLSAEELDRIRENCKTKRERAIVEFFRCTGLRVSEMVSVKISDVDWRTGKISVYGQKTRRYRIVFIDELAMKHIEEYLQERGLDMFSDQYLFVGERNKDRTTKDQIERSVKQLGQRSNIRLHPHLFRKTVATNIVLRGGSVVDAGDYLGHVDQTVVGKHYIHRSEDHIVNIFNNYVRAI